MLRRYDRVLGCHDSSVGSSVGLVLDTSGYSFWHLTSPLFWSDFCPVPSFFMLPSITAITIMLKSLGNRVIYSFEGKILDSKLQSPSLGTPDLPCLPGRWVGRKGCEHPRKLRVIQNGGRGIFTTGNVYGRNSWDGLTPPPSGSRACWVWMQVGRIELLESKWTLLWAQSPHMTHRISQEGSVEMPIVLLVSGWSTGIDYCPLSLGLLMKARAPEAIPV